MAELLKGVTGDTLDFAGFCKLLSSKFVSNQEAEQEILAAFKVRAQRAWAGRAVCVVGAVSTLDCDELFSV